MFNIVPSLFPFITAVNILRGTGFTHLIGELLSPVMVPLFNTSGSGAFPFITGLTSGYPMGAKTVAEMRRDGQLSQTEAQRLIGFCNNAGPLFILGVAGAGLFGSASTGYYLLISHVAAAVCMGFLMRFYKYNEKPKKLDSIDVLRNAYRAMRKYRESHDCSFGRVLGDGVQNAVESVLVIGGFIVFFCVLTRVFTITGVIEMLRGSVIMLSVVANRAASIFSPGGAGFTGASYSVSVIDGLITGTLEVTNGLKALASPDTGPVSNPHIVGAAAAIAFGGFSIHAQTLHFLKETDIKASVYLLCKLADALLAAGFCFLLLRFT
jgi:sporulation integral membrane protein YlbJ